MDDNRLNFPHSSAVTIEVLGNQLQFSQDPNSKHLGTTVWDASMVFVKFLERNCRRGRFCRSKLKGKRVLELGAGCGLAGFGMALLGCNVVSTDQIEVLPLLMRNLDRNTSRVMQTNTDSESFGSIEAAELDWGNMDHIKAVDPPFDYIIGTDIVYSEHLLEPLLHTICALSGPRSTILLGYEIRSMIVHEQMMDIWKRNFEVKTISKAKMDPKYQHSSIQLFILSFKNHVGPSREMLVYNPDCGEKNSDNEIDENSKHEMECLRGETFVVNDVAVGNDAVVNCEKLDDWEARRVGSLAARLLRDVTLG